MCDTLSLVPPSVFRKIRRNISGRFLQPRALCSWGGALWEGGSPNSRCSLPLAPLYVEEKPPLCGTAHTVLNLGSLQLYCASEKSGTRHTNLAFSCMSS